jgi:hypoxanthine phosphoribosyltransferase
MKRSTIHAVQEHLIAAAPNKLRHLLSIDDSTFLSMDDVDALLKVLMGKISFSGHNYDLVLGILQSGLYPAYMISKKLNCDIDFVCTNSNYLRDILFLHRFTLIHDSKGIPHPRLEKSLSREIHNKSVLLVDDECTYGRAFGLVEQNLRWHGNDVDTAVLMHYTKGGSLPNYSARKIEDRILYYHFPWRLYSPHHRSYEITLKRLGIVG